MQIPYMIKLVILFIVAALLLWSVMHYVWVDTFESKSLSSNKKSVNTSMDNYFYPVSYVNTQKYEQCLKKDSCCPVLYDRKDPSCNFYEFNNDSVFDSNVYISDTPPTPTNHSQSQTQFTESEANQSVQGLTLQGQMNTPAVGYGLLFENNSSVDTNIKKSVSLRDTYNNSIRSFNTNLNEVQTHVNHTQDTLQSTNQKIDQLNNHASTIKNNTGHVNSHIQNIKKQTNQVYQKNCHTTDTTLESACNQLKTFSTA